MTDVLVCDCKDLATSYVGKTIVDNEDPAVLWTIVGYSVKNTGIWLATHSYVFPLKKYLWRNMRRLSSVKMIKVDLFRDEEELTFSCVSTVSEYMPWLLDQLGKHKDMTASVDLTRFPHKCDKCGKPAYIGFTRAECSDPNCV